MKLKNKREKEEEKERKKQVPSCEKRRREEWEMRDPPEMGRANPFRSLFTQNLMPFWSNFSSFFLGSPQITISDKTQIAKFQLQVPNNNKKKNLKKNLKKKKMYMAYGWPQVIPLEQGLGPSSQRIIYLKLINRLLLVVSPSHLELWSSSQVTTLTPFLMFMSP